jgi:hypothetical protein
MNIKTILLYGWTLEKDPATGQYIFGSVPYYITKHYDTMRFYLMKKTPGLLKKSVNFARSWFRSWTSNHPKITLFFTAAAATVGYFVGVGIAWSLAVAILRFIRVF